MKKVFYGFVGVIIGVLVIAMVGPSFVDWNAYKGRIAAEAEKATGRKLTIAGDLSLSVLPLPTLSAAHIIFANAPNGGAEAMAAIEELNVRVALFPLLSGQVQIDQIELIRPAINLETYADGSNNWTLSPAEAAATQTTFPSTATPNDAAPTAAPTVSSGDGGAPFDVQLNNLHIVDGRLTYRDGATGKIEIVSGITADAGAQSLQGPFSFDGTLTYNAMTVQADVRVDTLAENKAAPINAVISVPGSGAELTANLLLSNLADGQGIRGKIAAKGPNLASMVAALTGASANAALSAPFDFGTTLTATPSSLRLDDLAIALGQNRMAGAVTGKLGEATEIDATLAFQTLTLDAFLPQDGGTAAKPAAPAASAPAPTQTTPGGSDTPSASGTASAPATSSFTLPTGLTVSLDVNGEAATYKGAVIGQPKLNAVLNNGKLTLNALTATLPGSGSVAASGTLAAVNGQPAFAAAVRTAAADLRVLLQAFGVDISTVPANRLHAFNGAIDASGTPSELKVSSLKLLVDTTSINGAASIRLTERPAFGATVKVDALNLDSYMPGASATNTPTNGGAPTASGTGSPATTPAQSKASTPSSQPMLAQLDVLNTFDANVQASVGELVQGGRTLKDITLDATLLDGNLTLKEARIGNFAGARVNVTGGLSGFGGAPIFDELRTHFVAPDMARWARAMKIDLPVNPADLNNLALNAVSTGDLTTLDMDVKLEAGGAVTNAKGTVKDVLTQPTFDMAVEAAHASLRRLIALFVPGYRPQAANLGAFAMTGRATGDLTKIGLNDLRLRLGPTNIVGKAAVDMAGTKPRLSADLEAGDLDVTGFLPAEKTAMAPTDLPFGVRAGIRPIAYKPGALAQHDTTPIVPAAAGSSRWSKAPLDLSALNAFDADVNFKAVSLSYNAFTLTDPTTTLNLKDGLADIKDLTAKMFGGAFKGAAKINGNGTPSLSGTLGVDTASIGQALLGAAGVDIADGLLTANMDLSAKGKSLFDLIKALSGSAAMQVSNGLVKGFDLKAVNDRVSNLDNVAGLLQLLQAGMTGGDTRFDALTGNFSIKDGVVNTKDITFAAPSGKGSAVATVDLANWSMDATGKFNLASMPDAPPFSMRLTGPIDQPRRLFDFNAFQQHLIASGLGRLLKNKGGKAGDILQQLIPGAKAPAQPQQQQQGPASGGWGTYDPNATGSQPQQQQQPTQPQPQQTAPKPEQMLRDLFKGFGR